MKRAVAELVRGGVGCAKNGVWIYAIIKDLLGVYIYSGDLGVINHNTRKKAISKYAAPTKKRLHIVFKSAKDLLHPVLPFRFKFANTGFALSSERLGSITAFKCLWRAF